MNAPHDAPEGKVGERCAHRVKRERIGTITAVSEPWPTWCTMKWENARGPKIVHRHELVLIVEGS